MEKMTWTRPMAEVEQFMPNEYIAACGDKTDPVYKFVCNAGGGANGGGWQETNGEPGLQSEGKWVSTGIFDGYWEYKADKRISSSSSSFHACDATHEVPVENVNQFLSNCYYKKAGSPDSAAIPVLIWRGLNNDNVHCCTGLTDIGSLPIIKS